MMRNARTAKRLVVMLALLVGALLHPQAASAATINLAWDPNPEPDIDAYIVHVGTSSGVYSQTFTVAVPGTTFAFTSAVAGTRYYFAVKARNTSNVISGFSNEVSAVGNRPPTLSAIPNRTDPSGTATSLNLASYASDPDGNTLTFSATNLPPGLTLNTSSGLISGTPSTAGTWQVTASVSDGQASASQTFTWQVTAVTTTITSLVSDHPTPQAPGRLITFTATASGGTTPHQFKYRVQSGTGAFTVARDWSTDASFVWTAGPQASYVIEAWVRSAGKTADTAEDTEQIPFSTRRNLDSTAPALEVTSHSQNQVLSTVSITLAGTATDFGFGGTGVSVTVNGTAANGGTAAGEATASWSLPITLTPGANTVSVQARDGVDNLREVALALNAQPPVTSVTLSTNMASPQPANTSIPLSITAAGGVAPQQHRLWSRLGSGAWVLLRDWNTSTSFTWIPTQDGSYSIVVHSKSAGVTGDVIQASAGIAFTIATPTPPVTAATLTGSLPSPQIVNTPITLTAGSSGGQSPLYRWWMQRNRGGWTLLRDWSAATTYAWTPTLTGGYEFVVQARSTGATTIQAEAGLDYLITSPLTGVTVTPSAASPQLVGATVSLTAQPIGGVQPVEFRWWAQRDGTGWFMLRDWQTDPTFVWSATTAGAYDIVVHGRSAGFTGGIEAAGGLAYVIGVPPVTSASLTASLASPQMLGTTMTLTASSTGGQAPVQYRWWIRQGSGLWSVLRNWDTSTTYTWTPALAGAYEFVVQARSAGVTTDTPQAEAGLGFIINAPPVASLTVTSSPSGSSLVNSPVALTATASSGSGAVEYRWWMQRNSEAWVMLADWSTSNTRSWTPTLTGGYTIVAQARRVGSATGNIEAEAALRLLVTTP